MHFLSPQTLFTALILTTAVAANPLVTAREAYRSSSLHSSLKNVWEKRQALPASLVIFAVDVLPALVEGGTFTGAVMDSMFGEMANEKPWAEKDNCRVEITTSKADYDNGRCWMKVWGKGEEGGVGKDDGGGRVIMDEECPSKGGRSGNGRGDDDEAIGNWMLVWEETGRACTDSGTSGLACQPKLTFGGHQYANGTKVILEIDVGEHKDNGHMNGDGSHGLCNIGRQGTSGGFKDGYDDYQCAVPCKEAEEIPE